MKDSRPHEQDNTSAASEGDCHPTCFGEAAEAVAGASAGPGRSLAEAQVQRLIEWAQARQRLIPEAEFEALPLVSDETGEHEVRFRECDRRVPKRTWTGTFGMVPAWQDGRWKPAVATTLEYFRRFELHNRLFQDDVRLEGIIISSRTGTLVEATPGGASIVISQRWLVAADPDNPHPVEDEIAAFMAELGFEAIPDSFFGWFSEKDALVLLDAKPDNLVKTSEGILPFDLLMLSLDDNL